MIKPFAYSLGPGLSNRNLKFPLMYRDPSILQYQVTILYILFRKKVRKGRCSLRFRVRVDPTGKKNAKIQFAICNSCFRCKCLPVCRFQSTLVNSEFRFGIAIAIEWSELRNLPLSVTFFTEYEGEILSNLKKEKKKNTNNPETCRRGLKGGRSG